jgi:hypothetical protein
VWLRCPWIFDNDGNCRYLKSERVPPLTSEEDPPVHFVLRGVASPRPPLTAEDLALLATPDAELRKRVQIFSFDQERFKARISTGDRWQQLLQAHLYFDHVITQLLVEALAKPDAIGAGRMSFLQKLQLIEALGLLPTELVPTVVFINGLRNKIAHDLNFEISDKDERDLANCTPKRLREIMETDKEREPGALRFHELLRVVLLQIEAIRQSKAFMRLLERKRLIGLRMALEDTPGAIYHP